VTLALLIPGVGMGGSGVTNTVNLAAVINGASTLTGRVAVERPLAATVSSVASFSAALTVTPPGGRRGVMSDAFFAYETIFPDTVIGPEDVIYPDGVLGRRGSQRGVGAAGSRGSLANAGPGSGRT
jgi:hypothetical protein